MQLTITLTAKEYVATQNALTTAIQEVRTLTQPQQLKVQHLRTLLTEASIVDRRDVPESGIVASVYLKGLSDQWDEANVTMDEARDWYKLPPTRQIQVVERMLSVVSLLTSLTEKKTST